MPIEVTRNSDGSIRTSLISEGDHDCWEDGTGQCGTCGASVPRPLALGDINLGYGQMDVYEDVHDERWSALRKHGERGSMEHKYWWSKAWLPVLMEEVGEVARVLCEDHLGNTSKDKTLDDLRAELVQVAAMACAWIDAVDYETDKQDKQDKEYYDKEDLSYYYNHRESGEVKKERETKEEGETKEKIQCGVYRYSPVGRVRSDEINWGEKEIMGGAEGTRCQEQVSYPWSLCKVHSEVNDSFTILNTTSYSD